MPTNDNRIPIPGRLHSVAVNPVVSGADEIYDDDLQLSQSRVNAAVFAEAVKTSLSISPTVVFNGAASSVSLTANSSIAMDSITLKQGDTVISTGSGTSLSGTHSVTPSANVTYTAVFVIGGLTKTANTTLNVVHPVKYGSGAVYTDAATNASARTTPAGTYNVTVAANESYVFFNVPATMTINSAKMGGFNFPLESPTNVTIDGVSYKSYKSSNTYDAGSLTIVIS